jgi:hypothetical protein
MVAEQARSSVRVLECRDPSDQRAGQRPQGTPWLRCRLLGRADLGMFAQVADQPDDVPGDEPSDGAAGIHADHHLAARVKHEAGGLEIHRSSLTKAPVEAAMARASALWPTGNRSPCLAIRPGVFVSPSADSAATDTSMPARRSSERRKACRWGVAVRAPRSPVEEDHAEVPGQGVWRAKGITAGEGHGERGERVAGVQEGHFGHAPLALARFASLTNAAAVTPAPEQAQGRKRRFGRRAWPGRVYVLSGWCQ